MGIGKHIERVFGAMLAGVLACGLVPAAAFGAGGFVDGVGVDAAGDQQMSSAAANGGAASSNVLVEVAVDDLELTDRSPNFVAADPAEALAFYRTGDAADAPSALWVQTAGGTAPLSGTWAVQRDGSDAGSFTAAQQPDGTWQLPLSADGADGSLKVEAGHEYDCAFAGADAQGRTVQATITFLVQASSPYAVKTVYKTAEETFDGVRAWAEPSATGIIHKFVQHLAATEGRPLDPMYGAFMRMAADYAAEQGKQGAYALASVWSMALKFTHDQPDAATEPSKGDLMVVVPIAGDPGDAPAAGSTVTVFGYGGIGEKEPFQSTVRVDDAGHKYVSFYDRTLGAYAVARYVAPGGGSGEGGGSGTDPDDPDDPVVKVTAEVEGAGFVNHPGTRTWPKAGAVRYEFTPMVPGNALDAVEVWVDGSPADVPAWATTAGYYDLDLGALGADAAEVRIRATFKATGGSGGSTGPTDPDDPNPPVDPDDPDDPASKEYTLSVVRQGEGAVAVSADAAPIASAPYRFKQGQAIGLICTPEDPCQSVGSVTLSVAGGPDMPLSVHDGAAAFTAPAADVTVTVVFSTEDAPPVPASTVKVVIEGGHGSIDVPFTTQQQAAVEAQKPVTGSVAATFTLYPEAGYRVYTATESDVEVGAYLSASEGAYGLRVPDIGRDRTIKVTFSKAEDLPPVVPAGTFVTIDVKAEGADGLPAGSLPTVTPPQTSIPKGAGYSFYVIPAATGDATVAYARMKGDADLTWRDATAELKWVVWPAGSSTGYWELALDKVSSDTHVRIGFRGLSDGEEPKLPCKTRNITINVVGNEWGAVFPNTAGSDPLRVPAGKTVVVTVVTKSGYRYEVKRADEARQAMVRDAGADITLDAPVADATGTGDITSTEIIGGADDGDEDWVFEFGPSGGSEGSSSSSGSSSGGSGGSPGGGQGGAGSGSSSGESQGGSSGGSGSADQGRFFKVTPIVVPDSAGAIHGRISPAQPVYVERGRSASFTFQRDVGYKVDYVEVNGERVSSPSNSGYTLANVQRDAVVKVAFRPQAETDAMKPAARAIHRMQSLAKTGDLTPPAMALLLCLAFGAGGAVLLAASRRREREGGPDPAQE